MKKKALIVIFAAIAVASALVLRFPLATPANSAAADNTRVTYIIDPGHGGADGGAVSGDVIESGLNLAVALKLDALMGLFGERTILTRDSNELNYPPEADTLRKMKSADSNARKKLVQDTPNAIYVSIHQNKFKSASAQGAQVFYGLFEGGKTLAETVQGTLRSALNPSNMKRAKLIPDSIFLMKDTRCPAILVECGFISNPSERALLIGDEYQTKIAIAVLAGLLQNDERAEENSGELLSPLQQQTNYG